MYMAVIEGWDIVLAFEETEEKAKDNAIKEKKKLCKDDLSKWTWDSVLEYYGAFCLKVEKGSTVSL